MIDDVPPAKATATVGPSETYVVVETDIGQHVTFHGYSPEEALNLAQEHFASSLPVNWRDKFATTEL